MSTSINWTTDPKFLGSKAAVDKWFSNVAHLDQETTKKQNKNQKNWGIGLGLPFFLTFLKLLIEPRNSLKSSLYLSKRDRRNSLNREY